jgi:hypothetical protein
MVLAAAGLPPCCAGCTAYDREDRVCRLLAEPTLDNRRTLLTMPCNPQRLLALRFRAYGPDVAREALVAWLDPAWDPDDLSLSYGRAPRDARLWVGSWPYLYLGRNAVRRVHRDGDRSAPEDREAPAPGSADPALGLRMTRALEQVRAVDAIGYAMLLDFLHDRFDAAAWAARLGWGGASVTDRKYLSVYRYAVYFHDVLDLVGSREATAALVARRFTPGEPSEHAALEATRAALSAPTLSMADWRQHYREGAATSLTRLAGPDALGPDTMAELGTAFRRVLRLDAGAR